MWDKDTPLLLGIPLHGQRLTHRQQIGLYPRSTAGPGAEWPLHGHAHGHVLQRPVCFCRGPDRSCFKGKLCSQTTEDDRCSWGRKKSGAAAGEAGDAAADGRPGPPEWNVELPVPQQLTSGSRHGRKPGSQPRSRQQKVATAQTNRLSAVRFSGQRNRIQTSREGKSRPPLPHGEPRDHNAQCGKLVPRGPMLGDSSNVVPGGVSHAGVESGGKDWGRGGDFVSWGQSSSCTR